MNKQCSYVSLIDGKFEAKNGNLLDPTTGAVSSNTQTFSGGFIRVGGTASDPGTAELADSPLLANKSFYCQFTEDPTDSVHSKKRSVAEELVLP